MGRGLKAPRVKKRLLLLRHARHAAGIHHQFLGSTDIGLSERGRLEAASIALLTNTYQPDRCFCSPLKRCIETIGPFSKLHLEINPDLREIDFGNWEGMTFDQIRDADPSSVDRWAHFDPDFAFPGGERIGDFLKRIRLVAGTLAACEGKTVLAVTHGGVIRALICHFLGLHPQQYLLFEIGYASLTTLDLFDEKGVLTGLNHYSRMEDL